MGQAHECLSVGSFSGDLYVRKVMKANDCASRGH